MVKFTVWRKNFTDETKKIKEVNVMRLDKFLKVSRIIKRRTVAKEVADKGRIQINGA